MNFTTTKVITIRSVPSLAWSALTDSKLLKKYFSAVNSPHVFALQEGKILDMIPEKLLHTIYPNAGGGVETISFDSYHVIYEIEAEDDHVTIRIKHENIESRERVQQIGDAWEKFLMAVKEDLETSRA